MDEPRPIFVLLAEIALKDGVKGIAKLPGLWVKRIDANWEVAVNPHLEDIEWAQTPDRMGCTVPPMHCAVMWNGWLAGLMSPYEGVIAANPNGDGANEENFVKALERAAA